MNSAVVNFAARRSANAARVAEAAEASAEQSNARSAASRTKIVLATAVVALGRLVGFYQRMVGKDIPHRRPHGARPPAVLPCARDRAAPLARIAAASALGAIGNRPA